MKYIGLAVLIIGAFRLSKVYLSRREAALKLSEGLLLLFMHIERELSSYMRSVKEAMSRFKGERGGEGEERELSEALSVLDSFGREEFLSYLRARLSGQTYSAVSDFLLERCRDSYIEEKERVSKARERLLLALCAEREKMSKTRITVPTLTAAISLGAAILFI